MSKVSAIHDDDLSRFLESLGLLEKLRAGQLTCHFCKTAVSESNLHAVFPFQRTIRIACDKPECTKALATQMASEGAGNG